MKYTCEICGRHFAGEEDCIKHETACKEKNETAFRIKMTIVDMIEDARRHGIKFGITASDGVCKFTGVEYEHDRNAVIVNLECD